MHKEFLPNFIKDSKEADGSFNNMVVSLRYDDTRKFLLVGHESGDIDIWDAKQALSKRVIKAHDYRANLLTFSTEGDAFFSNSYFEQTTKLWNVQTGGLICAIQNTRGPVSKTSDKRFYVIANSDELRIFDYKNKTLNPEKYRFSYDVVTALSYDISNDRVAVGTASGTIQILKFSLVHGEPKLDIISSARPYEMGNWVIGLQFTNDGQSLYSVTRLSSIDEWSIHPLQIKRSLPTTLKNVVSTAFMLDKGLLALAGTRENAYVPGYVEIHSLATRETSMFNVNTNLPKIEFLSPLSSVISAQHKLTGVYAPSTSEPNTSAALQNLSAAEEPCVYKEVMTDDEIKQCNSK